MRFIRTWRWYVAVAVACAAVAACSLTKNVEAYRNQGYDNRNLSQNQDTIADFDQALQLKHDDTNAYFYRGLARDNLGQSQDAFFDLRAAAALESAKAAVDSEAGTATRLTTRPRARFAKLPGDTA